MQQLNVFADDDVDAAAEAVGDVCSSLIVIYVPFDNQLVF